MVFLTSLDLNYNEIQNVKIQNLATDPTTGSTIGQLYYNTASKELRVYNGSQWIAVGTVYALPQATDTVLGGIKVNGSGLTIDANGNIGINYGSGLTIENGILKVTSGGEADSVPWSGVQDTPTTLEGYGITDGVQAINGKGLSTNDYTTEEKDKLAGISVGAEVNQNAFTTVKVGETNIAADAKQDTIEVVAGSGITITPNTTDDKVTIAVTADTYVEKVSGKGLSSNDYTDAEQIKLEGIAAGAEVNVQSDWNEVTSTSDAYILNKPTKLSDFSNDQGFITNTVNNLVNYYTTENTYTQTEVNALIGNIARVQIQYVNELPTQANASTNIIYLVPKADGTGTNVKDEYIWTGEAFEKIGDTQVDLTNYLTKTGDASDTTVTFTAASGRTNIATGEALDTIMGKIAKYLGDLKDVAFTGSYGDLENKPTNTIGVVTSTISTSITLTNNVYTAPSITIPSGKTYLYTLIRGVDGEQYQADIAYSNNTVNVTITSIPEQELTVSCYYIN